MFSIVTKVIAAGSENIKLLFDALNIDVVGKELIVKASSWYNDMIKFEFLLLTCTKALLRAYAGVGQYTTYERCIGSKEFGAVQFFCVTLLCRRY